MLWSMLTNRTLLWKYYDAESCYRYGSCCNARVCRTANVLADCDPILTRAQWIPSYDEWQARLHLPEPVELPYYTTHPPEMHDTLLPWGPGNDESVQGVDVLHNDTAVVVFPQMRYKVTWMANETIARMLLHSDWSRSLNMELFSLGADFLFGMLQHHSLQLTDQIRSSAIPQDAYHWYQSSHEYHTIALHSRHQFDSQNGCDIVQEQNCLHEILETLGQQTPRQQEQKTCVVALMSDRTCTIERLTEWLQQELNCRVFVAVHEDATYDYLFEHGPFAGAGFYEDLALASMARSAYIGTDRSSSDLVGELIVFHRTMEAWNASMHALPLLPNISSSIPSCRINHKMRTSEKWTEGPFPRNLVVDMNPSGTSTRTFYFRTPNTTRPQSGLLESLSITPKISCDSPNLRVNVTPWHVAGPIGTTFEFKETLKMHGCVNSSCFVSLMDANGAALGSPRIVTASCDQPVKRCYKLALSSCKCPYDPKCAEKIATQCTKLKKGMLPLAVKRYQRFCSEQSNSGNLANKVGPLLENPRW